MNITTMSAVEITRRKKVKAVRILSNLTYVDKMSDNEFRTVSEVVGLSLSQVKRAWMNFVYNGYIDGHAKNNRIKQIAVRDNRNPDTLAKQIEYASNSKKLTFYRIQKAIKLYLIGKSPMEIRDITGVGTVPLRNILDRLQQTGKITYSHSRTGWEAKSKKIFIPLDDMVSLNINRCIRYAKYKARENSPKGNDMLVDPCKGLNRIERQRYIAYYHFLCTKFNIQPIY